MGKRHDKLKKAIKDVIRYLPPWARDQQISIIAGMEMLVEYYPGQKIKLKTERCIKCGGCCMTFPGTVFGQDEEGKCKMLVKEGDLWICDAKYDKSFRCLQDPNKINDPDCAIQHDEFEAD